MNFHRIHRAWRGLAFGLGLGTAALAASPPVSAQTRLIVQGGASVPNSVYLNTYVAQQAGFFKEEGLDVEVRYSAGAALATQIAASGGADLADVTFEPYLMGYDKGLRGKFIFSRYDQLIYWIAVPADSPIKSVADLAGKKIGVASMGSSSLTIAKSMLRGANIDPQPSMFLPVGTGDSAIAALKSDQIQALSLWDAAYASLERSGMKLRYLIHPKIGGVGNGGFFVSDRTLADKRPALIGFLRGLVKARVFIRTNPEAALRIYWKVNPAAKPAGSEAEALAKGLAEIRFRSATFNDDPIDRTGVFNLTGTADYLKVMRDEGLYKMDFKPADLVTNELIEQADKIDPKPVIELARDWKN